MHPTITPPKTFRLKTHLIFTTIEIRKFGFVRTGYIATFKAGSSDQYLKDSSVKGITLQNCLENVSKFLDCQIDERHYIIK